MKLQDYLIYNFPSYKQLQYPTMEHYYSLSPLFKFQIYFPVSNRFFFTEEETVTACKS